MRSGASSYEYLSCQKTTGLVWNLTSSYTDKSNEASMVSASVIVFALAALFFNLNLFSSISDVGAILDPKVRVVLSKALSLFLPVMSYLFSEAKNSGASASAAGGPLELSLRARLILVWMLLVELLRKKVEEIRMEAWHTGTVERAGRVAWLGSLVFFNLHAAGRKAVFGILWTLCAAKLVQRMTYSEVGKRSFAYGKNAKLVISYMAQMLENDVQVEHHHGCHGGDELLRRCKYLVLGEEDLVIEPISSGYRINGDIDAAAVTTVGKIWTLAESDHLLASLDKDQRLRRLCLSFALFKLLRRSFEHLPPMTEAETRHCRDLIFRGLYNGGGGGEAGAADALFQVMSDEADFLSEYYHSVVPVVLASPFFLLANYVLLPLVVLVLCLVVVVLCGNGDVLFSLRSIERDNYTMSSGGVVTMVRCLLRAVTTSPPAFFTAIDLSITLLLFLIMVYEEVWEFVVFLLSNWFMVSLLHAYTSANPRWRDSAVLSWAIRRILWARSKMLSHHGLRFKQFSVLSSCRLSLNLPAAVSLALPILPTVPVPGQVKHSIAEYLAKSLYDGGDAVLFTARNGRSAVSEHPELLPFCESDGGIAEIILTWHIATGILEEKCPPPPHAQSDAVVATRLSRYLSYLVAFHPELLSGNQDNTELVFQAMNDELRQVLGFWGYHLPPLLMLGRARRFDPDMVRMPGNAEQPAAPTVLQKGAALGGALVEKERDGSGGGVWKVVGDVWVELAVDVAPASDEERVMGHRKVLPEGGEFITVLWALATHTGIRRRPTADTTYGV